MCLSARGREGEREGEMETRLSFFNYFQKKRALTFAQKLFKVQLSKPALYDLFGLIRSGKMSHLWKPSRGDQKLQTESA